MSGLNAQQVQALKSTLTHAKWMLSKHQRTSAFPNVQFLLDLAIERAEFRESDAPYNDGDLQLYCIDIIDEAMMDGNSEIIEELSPVRS